MDLLSDYVLLEIFEKLDEYSLVVAINVCKRWSQLITTSASLMKRFTLSIIVSNDQSFHVYRKFRDGIYQNLVIKGLLKQNALSTEFYEHLSSYRETVRNLILKDFLMSDVISTLLKFNLNNITKLVLISSAIMPNKITMTQIELPKLTHLELTNTVEFLQYLKIHRVNILKISNYDNFLKTFCHNTADLLNSFLYHCHNLEELTLSQFNNPSTPFNFNINECKFNLVSLTIESSIINNLQEFLLSQKNSLRNFAIWCENHDFQLMRVIFYELKLTQLEIDVKTMPEDFPTRNKNSTIKQLILRVFQPRNNFYQVVMNPHGKAKNIIEICSAVEEISIHYFDSANLLLKICESMKNLKVLRNNNLSSKVPLFFQFDNLEYLEVDVINNKEELKGLINIATESPKLRYIRVNRIRTDVLTEDVFIKIIYNARKLEELHIGSNCYFTSNMNKALRCAKTWRRPLRKLTMARNKRRPFNNYDANNIEMRDLITSFCDDFRKIFTSFINKSKLNGMERDAYVIVK